MMKYKKFQEVIWNYFRENKRDLPWRRTTDPYKILISEVMLQQTQVARIIPKYESFLKRFPNFYALAASSLTELLAEWKGIGYNRRALYLRTLAQRVVSEFNGVLPDDPKILETFPGIGWATANSITVYAFNKPVVFIETNIRRIYIHHFFKDKENVDDKDVKRIVEETLDKSNPREWYWALMDYGTMLAKTIPNPNVRSKHYVKQSKFEGSTRQLRSRALHYIAERKSVTFKEVDRLLEDERLFDILQELVKEGFVKYEREKYTIA